MSLIAMAAFWLAGLMNGAPAPVLAGQTPEGAALDGAWRLNDELSNGPNPRSWRGERTGNDRQGNGGFGGGFGGFGRGGSFGGRRYPGYRQPGGRDEPAGDRAARQRAIEDLTTAPRRMTITTGRREIELRYGDGRLVRLIPDDREHTGLAGTSLAVKRVTAWKGETLTTRIDLQTNRRFRVHQTYALGLEGTRLTVTSRYEGSDVGDDEDREFRQVYERVTDE